MEILRSNFPGSLATISEAIDSASFLAIDAEFSGLNVKWGVENSLDTPQERYSKLKQGSKDFIIIQFGLCTFAWDKKKECYTAKPFNFYIFPKVWNRQCPDVRFLCQSSSIDFLTEHNFDFNKLFREGISYLRPYDESKLREHFLARNAQDSFTSASLTSPDTTTETSGGSSHKTPRSVPPEHRDFVEKACNSIEEMLKDPEGTVTKLPPCNGYLRKLIYQTVKQRFKAGIHMEAATNEKKERFIVVTKVNEDQKRKLEEDKQAKEQHLIENAVGFSQVVKMISQSGKVIVGHNMFLDLLHVIDQFLCPLPELLEDFKATVSAVFPRLVDTKVMANTQPFRDLIPSSVLADLVKHVSKKPFQKPAVLFDPDCAWDGESNEKPHEAGYDAFITGMSFISMANYLGSFQEPPKVYIPSDSTLIVPFVNKIFVMRMEDIPYVNLAGPDLNPSRDHVFYLTFPSDWKQSDILDLFNNFGFVYISWIDSTSAFISLARREHASNVLQALDCEGECYTIVSYAEHKRQLYGVCDDDDELERLRTPLKRPRFMEEAGWKTSSPKEIQASKKDNSVISEPEDGEIVDDEESLEPVRKKQKKESKVFEEPDDW
ncbi:unnamed protein product [Porites lobata]|uniref:Poly(A)-specific ribonuclease PARN n=1 Tax=Porites lobata TaxID=104759 RepID=A0ABN8NZW9_9CNID|nr:unnamed protein product [Porites lobata]